MAGAIRGMAFQAGLEYLEALGLTTDVSAEAISTKAWAVSMHVTSVATIKRATANGASLAVASALGQRRSLGAAQRYVLDAQRDVIRRSSVTSGKSHGWRRVGVGPADCAFCTMLIGRGDVYTEESVKFRSHDHCDCMAEPVIH